MNANKLRFLFVFLLVNAFAGLAEASSGIIQTKNEISSSQQNHALKTKNEVAIAPKANDSFAACILVMDDNHRIIGM